MTGKWVVLCFRKQSIILEVSKEKPIFKTSFLDTHARKIANKFDLWSYFVTTQQMKCKHFFVFAAPKFGYSLT
jgi:hypothetical protein